MEGAAAMNGPQYNEFMATLSELDEVAVAAALMANPFSTTWQFSDALRSCQTQAEAQAVIEANPKLAAQVAETTEAYQCMCAGDRGANALEAAVLAAPTAEAAAAIMGAAPPELYTQVASRLCFANADSETVTELYMRECVRRSA